MGGRRRVDLMEKDPSAAPGFMIIKAKNGHKDSNIFIGHFLIFI